MSEFKIQIQHPDWLSRSNPGRVLRLYREGKLPSEIAGWMLVVSLKHPLRAIYGSDLRAALALLWQAIREPILTKWIRLKWRVSLCMIPDDCVVGGLSGDDTPAWNDSEGATTDDFALIWTNQGAASGQPASAGSKEIENERT